MIPHPPPPPPPPPFAAHFAAFCVLRFCGLVTLSLYLPGSVPVDYYPLPTDDFAGVLRWITYPPVVLHAARFPDVPHPVLDVRFYRAFRTCPRFGFCGSTFLPLPRYYLPPPRLMVCAVGFAGYPPTPLPTPYHHSWMIMCCWTFG